MIRQTPAPGDAVSQSVLAGLITTMVGFVASFAVVLAGLFPVGASREQAASALLVLSLTVGLSTIGLSLRHRLPISIA
ncbi:putative benzoate:H+ symporter BenE [Glutamicibacter nicotianae]|nr:putative benzoate:H+ symporter BenE [Glutamicibacter nicotianae]